MNRFLNDDFSGNALRILIGFRFTSRPIDEQRSGRFSGGCDVSTSRYPPRMADERDVLTDPITRDLIGVLTGCIEMRKSDGAIEDEAFLGALGTLVKQVMPSFTISGTMTSEELNRRLNDELSGHLMRMVSCFGYLFVELAETNDSLVETSTADLLREISLEIERRKEAD